MTREEHLAWCKKRAHEYLDRGDIANGVTSMISDLSKHPETRLAEGSPLGMLGIMAVMQKDHHGAVRFVDGFN
jgi:hypothetical protein